MSYSPFKPMARGLAVREWVIKPNTGDSMNIWSGLARVVAIAACVSFSMPSHAARPPDDPDPPTNTVRYYGYDWLDMNYPGYGADVAFDYITISGFSSTNLNVVHSIGSLNLSACSDGKCAVNIQAGSGSIANGSPWLDICPGASSDSECQGAGSWNRIWGIVAQLAQAQNMPSAVYFIDEPFDNPALRTNGAYVQYQYSSYLCTLREAMQAHGMNIPVYTVLSYPQSKVSTYVSEIQTHMPVAGCPASVKSNPDWIGVDNYHWDMADMLNTYSHVAPADVAGSPRWVLVPPSASSLGMSDTQLHDQIQLYWDFMQAYPWAPVIMVMNWHFDPAVLAKDGAYPKSRALLSFMANTITSP